MLEIDVRARFGAFPLDVRLEVPQGVTALVGPSGAGKSSLLRLVAGLARPGEGRIALDGEVLCETDAGMVVRPEDRRIGMVFQRPALVPHFGVMANIALGARGRKVSSGLVERTGCAPLLHRPVAALSGGERQRVMLARALAGQPRILLFDEPMSALDPVSKAEMLALFAEIMPTLGVPALYVTHAMEEAGQVAARFAFMREGRIAAAGDAATVLSQYGSAGEGGIAGVLKGVVRSVAEDGLATIDIGAGLVETVGAGLAPGAEVLLRVSARDVILARAAPRGISARNALHGCIARLQDVEGGQVAIAVDVGGQTVMAVVMARTVREMDLGAGQAIVAVFKSASIERVNSPVSADRAGRRSA